MCDLAVCFLAVLLIGSSLCCCADSGRSKQPNETSTESNAADTAGSETTAGEVPEINSHDTGDGLQSSEARADGAQPLSREVPGPPDHGLSENNSSGGPRFCE